MAWILPEDGVKITEESLRAYCKGKIAHFKIPKYWKFVYSKEEIPMTVTGKIQKFKMIERAIIELNLQEDDSVETA
jgi:fatty-acyl-CoA synthase